jgi:hypothetical protein
MMSQPKGHKDEIVEVSGELSLAMVPYKGLRLAISFQELQVQHHDYLVARFLCTETD